MLSILFIYHVLSVEDDGIGTDRWMDNSGVKSAELLDAVHTLPNLTVLNIRNKTMRFS